MFYVKKEKQQDHLAILEHDHLSFTTVSKTAVTPIEGKTHHFIGATSLVCPSDDRMIE